jgi:hypothetical protein
MSGTSAELYSGIQGCFVACEYPGFMALTDTGYFSQYSSGTDAEILNLFDDKMYIGPYYDPVSTSLGTFMTYRSGAGNDGDGAWFVNTYQEYIFNGLVSDAIAENNICFLVKGQVGEPSKTVHYVQAVQTGTVVQALSSISTGSAPIESVVQNRVATTNATVTTLHTFTVPASTTYAVEVIVIARRTGGSAGTAEDGARYKLSAVYKNAAGTATIIGAITSTADESVAGYDATLDTTGASIRVRVTGVLNTNITWHMTARVYSVST